MQTPSPHRASAGRLGLWVTLAAALAYCAWLGAHWLPLGYSDKEFGGFVSRVWDVQREWREHRHLAWWTPFYMSGSSYGLNHSQGLYLLPSLFFASFTDIHTAVKLTALLAILGGALAMYGCARYFLRPAPSAAEDAGQQNEWAAALAAIAFLLHPEQVIRAAGEEHLGVIVFMPFMPLTFWLFARALESGRFRDIFCCGLSAFGLLWAHNKMAFVHGVFLAGYLGFWLWRKPGLQRTLRTLVTLGAVTAGLCAVLVAPGLMESGHVKLLSGEQEALRGWQRGFAFKSLLALVDRDAVVTRATTGTLTRLLQSNAFRPASEAEADEMRAGIHRLFSLTSESPEKYAGLVALAVAAVTVLWNRRRANRRLFWFWIGCLLLSVMLACGPDTVWRANWQTGRAVFGLPVALGVIRPAVLLSLAAVVAFLALFYRRKLTTARKRLWAAGALAAFLFLPAFPILATVPFFKEIRAPYVFYDGPGTFFVAMLVGFFVTDVLNDGAEPARPAHTVARRVVSSRRAGWVVGAVAVLMLVDYWPYQRPCKDNGVPARTLQNLQTTYAAFRQDPDWVKTYSISGRYFHLLGPSYGGKPQVYEAFYNWMSPLGTGLLNQSGLSREMLNLFGARYLVCDKTDPQTDPRWFAQLRQAFPNVAHEDEDFLVLRNDTAHPYVSATTKVCEFRGDVRRSAPVTLWLASKHFTLVHGPLSRLRPEQTYDDSAPPVPPAAESAPLSLTDVRLARESSHRIRVRLTAPQDCVAVIAESYYPFWRATVDGTPAELLRVNTALMGVELVAGAHEIVLSYRVPRAYAAAGIVSVLAFAIGLAATIGSCRAGRSPG